MIILHTSLGPITIELAAEQTPKTVENFLNYVQSGFYEGTIFHRVVKNFVIQGGGFTPDMDQKATEAPIENEADLGLNNDAGTICMARTQDPHSATCQFFINLRNNDFLNFSDKSVHGWGYCAFGKVTEGMDVVEKIGAVATGNQAGHQDVPNEPVVIERVEVLAAVE